MLNNQSYGFLALVLRQSNIKRWSLMRCIQQETVLEHSATVAILALLVGQIARENGRDVSIEIMLSNAILHDAAECLCGDVVTPVKTANPAIRAEFKKLEKAAEERLIGTLPDVLKEPMAFSFQPGGYEQVLVKGCDIYASYIKCITEIEAGNRLEFEDAQVKIRETLDVYMKQCPEIAILDSWFTQGFSMSVDKLLTGAA